jgi:hypothetical protein
MTAQRGTHSVIRIYKTVPSILPKRQMEKPKAAKQIKIVLKK